MLLSEIELARELQRAGCGIVNGPPRTWPIAEMPKQPQRRTRLKCPMALQEVVEAVAKEHGVTVAWIISRSRKSHVVDARHAAIRAVAKAVDWQPSQGNWRGHAWSTTRIGKIFDRDYSTVLYALGRHKGKRRARPWASR